MGAYQITISRLRRYPVKGFKGHDIEQARLEAGGGVPCDRQLALLVPPVPDLSTTDRGQLPYMYLSRNPALARYRTEWDGGNALRFIAPDGDTVSVDPATNQGFDEANRAFARWFGDRPGGPPRLSPLRQDGGYWDFGDTALSIINLATVRDIARSAGREINPLRFRANIYIDGLPAWREFDLVGKRLKAGNAEFDVLRGIARCNATSIDPERDEVDMNMPLHLRHTYGHLFCGVYARVASSGTVRPGMMMTITGPYGADPYLLKAVTSRPAAEWPRFVTVTREDDGLTLSSPLERWPLLPPRYGEYLRIHPTGGHPETTLKAPLLASSSAEAYRIGAAGLEKAAEELLISGPYPAGATS
jgi:uncharacterized protein YcbX